MQNSRTLRTNLKKLSSLSTNQPSFYFMHGYFVGLAINPDLIPPSAWLPALLGEINFEQESDTALMNDLMAQYNQVMEQCLEGSIKLPSQCKLSKDNLAHSLSSDQPLPEWCEGILASLYLISYESLAPEQQMILRESEDVFLALTSFTNLKAFFRELTYIEHAASELRRNLVSDIQLLMTAIRFIHDAPAHEEDTFAQEFLEDFNETLDIALFEDSPEAYALLDEMIEGYEQTVGPSFFEENEGHFWMLHETRPYMELRARRARLKFSKGFLNTAIEEMKSLIVLNPSDNQGNRFILASWLVIAEAWTDLETLLQQFADDRSIPLMASNALMLYETKGENEEANKAKKDLITANKHTIKYLTGQKKVKHPPEFYQPGEASEAEMYVLENGKEAWRSVPGAIFWLKRK